MYFFIWNLFFKYMLIKPLMMYKYLLITLVRGPYCKYYGPRVSPSIYGPSAEGAGYKLKGKNKGP